MKDYRKLIVWQKAHRLVLQIYMVTKTFPKEELYGLTSQLRRATAPIPTNIAEGSGKFSQLDFANFLQVSLGSAQEVEYLNFLSFKLKFVEEKLYAALAQNIGEVKAMLISLIQKIRK